MTFFQFPSHRLEYRVSRKVTQKFYQMYEILHFLRVVFLTIRINATGENINAERVVSSSSRQVSIKKRENIQHVLAFNACSKFRVGRK